MLNNIVKSNKIKSHGFTLIELMVSLTIFSVVMVISTGTLLIMIDANAKAQAIYSASSNLTFALDNITREIRMGYHYNCFTTNGGAPTDSLPNQSSTVDCATTPGNSIAFTREKDGSQVGYRINTTSSNPRIEQKIDNGLWVPLTSDDVFIEEFEIIVNNSTTYLPGENNTRQPTIDIFIKGYVNNGLDTDTDFTLQSRVIQRRLDII